MFKDVLSDRKVCFPKQILDNVELEAREDKFLLFSEMNSLEAHKQKSWT